MRSRIGAKFKMAEKPVGREKDLTPVQTDVVVHTQLQDVIFAQRKAYEKLKSKMESIANDMIPKDQYEKLLKQLEDEKIAHAKTKSKLLSESDKLQFALGEIEILTKQLEREKSTFEQAISQVKSKALKETSKNEKLVNKCAEIEAQCEEQEDVLSAKDAAINDLKEKLVKQKENHKQQLSEMDIQLKQEAYIAQMLSTGVKSKSSSSKSYRV
ncbi:spermatogenesis-associated protein 24-like [Saccoglossus kowalevskii]|uniref:Spermatogenesis-associated protein 24-like n=1 Tax=Saccoglossus kowalevskii TaxID=10224 RepID=A0ABM0GNQ6_SACKO|nr:PREDICTED: spermatogenesis-associated protein 24-like [Saccoglossus kowalevskii]